jgi:hypothetical protein
VLDRVLVPYKRLQSLEAWQHAPFYNQNFVLTD